MGICVLILAGIALVRINYLRTGDPFLKWPLLSPYPHKTMFYHLGSIAFGCLLALGEPFLTSWRKNWWIGYAMWGTGISLIYYLFFLVNWSYRWGEWYFYNLSYIGIGLLILAGFNGVSFFSRFKVMQWIGRHSYGIYLWHYILLVLWSSWASVISLPLALLGFIVSSIAAGALSTKVIEHYFMPFRP